MDGISYITAGYFNGYSINNNKLYTVGDNSRGQLGLVIQM